MRYLKSFNESIKDIHSICKTYNITNYTINDDGSIDVNDNVDLSRKELSKLPLKFRNVTGFFDCFNNKLKSLEGSPRTVGRSFSCYNNQLTSLEGSPRTVGGYFSCENNQLTSLEGAPISVNGDFYCDNNPISKWWYQINNKEKLEVFIDLNINSEDPDWINQEKIDYIK